MRGWGWGAGNGLTGCVHFKITQLSQKLGCNFCHMAQILKSKVLFFGETPSLTPSGEVEGVGGGASTGGKDQRYRPSDRQMVKEEKSGRTLRSLL